MSSAPVCPSPLVYVAVLDLDCELSYAAGMGGQGMGVGGRHAGFGQLSRLCVFSFFPLIFVACQATDPAPESSSPPLTTWLHYREQAGSRERYLTIQQDGSYESAILHEHIARHGTLSDEQRTRLLKLISEDQFEAYLEEGLADGCEAAIRDGVAVTIVLWQRDSHDWRRGCWARDDAKGEQTVKFIDTISDVQMELIGQ
jgi:hypothetical protein